MSARRACSVVLSLALVLSTLLAGWLTGSVRGHTEATRPRGASSAGSRPNIVVLLADDLDLLSFQVASVAGFLPNLARLFAEGTRFRESFVSTSLCCPSRATYLTGLYAHNHGVVRNGGPHGGFSTFMRGFSRNHLALWMQQAGYRTGYVGKYLNGYVDGRSVPPGWDDWHVLVDPTTYCMYGYLLSHRGDPVYYGHDRLRDYQTDVLAAAAESVVLDWRTADASRPLFLSISTPAPHKEWSCYDGIRPAPRHARTPPLRMPMPPSFNEEDMTDKPGWMRALLPVDEATMERLYNERIVSLRAVDDLVGRLVAALEAAGELERTAFVFTSDNGYLLGRHRIEGKVVLYEESIRVPLMLRLPDISGPRFVDAIALNNDLAPTLADLAGATPGLVPDGRSLLPLLEEASVPWRNRFLVAFPPAGRAPDRSPEVPPFFAIRTGDDGDLGGLAYGETTTEGGGLVVAREFYNLAADPYQTMSGHHDPAQLPRLQRLKEHLETLKTCGQGTCQTREQ
jgi:N-acetylglucosamine-6-sulfatase